MSKVHVLEGSGASPGTFRVIVHVATPVGNNSAGTSWATALVNTKRNFTRMVVGVGPGQITSAERDQIVAGAMMEGEFTVGDDLSFTGPQRAAYLDTMADRFIVDMQADAALQLKYFGATRP